MNVNEMFWKNQMDTYQGRNDCKQIRYESWQPGRWASNRAAIQIIRSKIDNIQSTCELGAGSAAFSMEMHKQTGCSIDAVDLSIYARNYAENIAKDMGIPIVYHTGDLFDFHGKFDFISSLGVIEHFQRDQQMEFIQKCAQCAKQYVLVAIPNQNSIIFRSYVRWASQCDREYEEKHQPLGVEELKNMMEKCGLRILHVDGFQVFLSEKEFWHNTDVHEISIYKKLIKNVLTNKNLPDRWREFPYFDFSYEDIPYMVELETSLSCEERMRNGFMTYVLAQVQG